MEADCTEGIVEVDVADIRDKKANKHAIQKLRARRETVVKQAVMGLKQRGGTINAMPITESSTKTLGRKVFYTVEDGATVYSDERAGYENLNEWHQQETIKRSVKEFGNGIVHTNGIECV